MSKRHKVTIIILLLTTLVSQLFSEKKLTIWCSSQEYEGLEPVAKRFKKKERTAVFLEIQSEVRSKYLSAAISKTGPDIVVGANDWVGEFAKHGIITPLKLSSKDKSRFFDVAVDGFTFNGKLYGVPYSMEALILIYNKNFVSELPKTWEELLIQAKSLTTKDGKFGFLYGIDNNFYNNFPFFGSQGGYIFKQKNNTFDIMDVGLANNGSIAGANFINKLVKQGIVPSITNNGIVSQSFRDQKVAIVMDGPWNIKSYKESIGKDNLGVSKLPTLNGKKSVPFVSARGFMVNSATKTADIAKKFILEYASKKEGQIAMYRAGGRPPAEKDACEYAISKDNTVKTVIDSANDGIAMPNLKEMAVIWNYAATMIDNFKTGEMTVEEALKSSVEKIEDKLKSK